MVILSLELWLLQLVQRQELRVQVTETREDNAHAGLLVGGAAVNWSQWD